MAEDGKAVPVTQRVLFRGRSAIATPGAPGVNVSRRIRDEGERARLVSAKMTAENPAEASPAAAAGGREPTSPPPTGSYEPSAAQRRLVTVRDRHCRMPGCGRRAGTCDLDHGHPYADGGPTACENLCCLCRSHHRLKTFARNWRFRMGPDGTLTVTTPSGITRTTRPPGLREQRALPPPRPAPVDESPPPF